MPKIKVETKEIEGETWFKFKNKFDEVRYFYGNLMTLLLIIILIIGMVVLFLKIFPYINLLRTNPCQLCEGLGYLCNKPTLLTFEIAPHNSSYKLF